MTALRRVVVGGALAAVLAPAAVGAGETTVRVMVPDEVAGRAARRAAGDATASVPILILEGVEIGDAEGLTIRILGPPEPGSPTPGPVLAVASMVGRAQATPRSPLQKVTLAVPLNDRASKVLAGRSEVTLTLKVTNSPGRPPVKVDRAFFRDP
jgi:hypothetical protein